MSTKTSRKPAVYTIILSVFSVVVSTLVLVSWMNAAVSDDIIFMGPDLDGTPPAVQTSQGSEIGSFHREFDTITSNLTGSWPGFRGPDRSNISTEGVRLADSWGETGPVTVWKVSLGDGHAAAAIHRGRVYVLDYEEATSMDLLRCFDLVTGSELWQTGYPNPIKRNHGRSRSIPIVTDEVVITIGPGGHVMATAASNGNFLWGKDLAAEYSSEIPLWYSAQNPLVADGKFLLAVCGSSILVEAVNPVTGETVWSIPNTRGYALSHASITPVVIDGVTQYIYAALGGIIGFDTEGNLLWEEPWEPAVIAPSPVQSGANRIFLTAGYGVGSMLLDVKLQDDEWITRKVFNRLPPEGLSCEQQTPIFSNGYLYAIMPKDGGIYREEFVCADSEGNILWTSGPLLRFGLGPWMLADGKFFILREDATLFMIDAAADSWKIFDSARIFEGTDAWGPLAVADGFLVLRDSSTMVCLDMREETYR